jgi:hypothetical protein
VPAHRLEVRTSDRGVTVIDDTFNANPDGARHALDLLARVDASGRRVVVTPGMVELGAEQAAANEQFARLATEAADTLVVVGRTLNHPRVDRVTADHWSGGYHAVEHLISLGHKRIGFIGVSPINGAGLRRYQGYLDALRENSLQIDEKLIIGPSAQSGPGYSTQDDGYAGMQKLLALKKPPTAVFARNDFTAIGAICAIRDAKRQIPDDIAVVGFDDVALAAYSTPPLTTVRQPTTEQGREAARTWRIASAMSSSSGRSSSWTRRYSGSDGSTSSFGSKIRLSTGSAT